MQPKKKKSFPKRSKNTNKISGHKLHPITIRELKKGHPWVTKDKFSMEFPKHECLIKGLDSRDQPLVTLINDPTHPKVKARLWKIGEMETSFEKDFSNRMSVAIQKRQSLISERSRENLYLVFGEADDLPGLFILALGSNILISYYSYFWEKHTHQIVDYLRKNLDSCFKTAWLSKRNLKKEKKLSSYPLAGSGKKSSFSLKEFEINYQIEIDEYYDFGLYTDMASIRERLTPIFEDSDSVLNLYSYTGAYSLYALKHGASSVVSVDLSKKYQDWLEKNLELNPELSNNHHQSVTSPVEKYIDESIAQKRSFDFVICDPPSFSSDGNKTEQAFKNYQKLLPKLIKLTAPRGNIAIFLNTHSINKRKFEKLVVDVLRGQKRQCFIEKHLGLSVDCPTLKSFPEGSYLKGFLIQCR